MDSEQPSGRITASEWLLLALIVSLPFMKPAISYPILLTDLIFILLLVAVAAEILLGRRRIQWKPAYWILLLYVASFVPSLLATPDLPLSMVKLASEFYLVGLAAVTALIVDDRAKMRRAIIAWLLATSVVCFDALLSLTAFVTGRGGWLLEYSRFHFGTLPPGHYPRLCMTFFNANMACNYLTVSLGLTVAARACGWLGRGTFALLVSGIAVAALSTISPGLGGIALLIGVWIWLTCRAHRPRLAAGTLTAGIAAALLFVIALAFTPIPHWTAPFLIHLPGDIVIAPAGRFLTWSAALAEFGRHPLVGHGIGIDAVLVHYADPSGYLQTLTDAHNMFLSVAAQCGLAGLVGLAAVIALAVRLTGRLRIASRGDALRLALGLSFLNAFVYQGLGGSFEDARHLWVLLGLLIAAPAISLSDGNNRRAGAPSPC